MIMDPVTVLIVDSRSEDRQSYRRMLADDNEQEYVTQEAEDAAKG